MTAVKIAELVLAGLAMGCLVASEALSWGLSSMVAGLLGVLVGLAAKRPSDMLAPKIGP